MENFLIYGVIQSTKNLGSKQHGSVLVYLHMWRLILVAQDSKISNTTIRLLEKDVHCI